jgi:hypothetical protein
VSGHTWKHLAAAASTYAILCMLERRQPLAPPPGSLGRAEPVGDQLA